jgi:hypothetical protein
MKQPHPFETLMAYLPASVQELLTVISLGAAIKLIKARGGTRIQIPSTADAGHWLSELIGTKELEKLCQYYGREALVLPRCTNAMMMLRDANILKDRRDGLSYSDLALKYQMTEDGINKALRRIEQQERQPWAQTAKAWRQVSLFDEWESNNG